jgi:hypothetical protein
MKMNVTIEHIPQIHKEAIIAARDATEKYFTQILAS